MVDEVELNQRGQQYILAQNDLNNVFMCQNKLFSSTLSLSLYVTLLHVYKTVDQINHWLLFDRMIKKYVPLSLVILFF